MPLYLRPHWRDQGLASGQPSWKRVFKSLRMYEAVQIPHLQQIYLLVLDKGTNDLSYQVWQRSRYSFFRNIISNLEGFYQPVLHYLCNHKSITMQCRLFHLSRDRSFYPRDGNELLGRISSRLRGFTMGLQFLILNPHCQLLHCHRPPKLSPMFS